MTLATVGDTKAVGTPDKVIVVPLEVTVGGETVIPPCANPVVEKAIGCPERDVAVNVRLLE